MQKPLEIRRNPPTGRLPVRKQTLAKRVREVLIAFGGEAHRTLVIQQVARAMGHDAREIPEELEAALIVSFEEYWRDEQKRAAFGFHLPFGEGSHRWGVKAEPVYLH